MNPMYKAIGIIFLSLFLLVFTGIFSIAVAATGTAFTSFSIAVSPINELSISGATVTLTIVDPGTPTNPSAATNNGTTYNITTNSANTKIKAQLDTAVPTGTTLTLNLAAPGTATSQGDVTLTTTASDIVTGIKGNASSGNVITYKFYTTPAAGTFSGVTRTVTLTISEL